MPKQTAALPGRCNFITSVLTLFLLAASVLSSDVLTQSGIGVPTDNPCKPEQVHLSFGDSIDEINVVWATRGRCLSKVKYATHPWGFENVAMGDYAHFTLFNDMGRQHLYRVKLQNLLPDSQYYYIPVSNGSSAGPFYFHMPKAGHDWSPHFLMFGDLGIHADTIPSLINEALAGTYTAVIHVGDIAYDLHNENGLLGDYFLNLIQPMAASIPYMTCPGNHEINEDSFSHYRHRFAMPASKWPMSVSKLWYSIDIGPVHFVSYSSEVFFTLDGSYVETQQRWLEEDLLAANNNRNVTPWIVAFGHRPMYCSTRIGDDCSQSFSLVRSGLEDIFHHFSVDLIIQAHEHNYERLWPVYKGEVKNHTYENPSVPVQIITGAAGSTEGTDFFIPGDRPAWSAFRLDEKSFNSYGRLLVENCSHLFWEQRSINNHEVVDSIWIVQEGRIVQRTTEMPESNFFSSFSNITVIAICTCVLVVLVLLSVFGVRRMLKNNRKRSFFQYWSHRSYEWKEEQGPDNGSDSDFDS